MTVPAIAYSLWYPWPPSSTATRVPTPQPHLNPAPGHLAEDWADHLDSAMSIDYDCTYHSLFSMIGWAGVTSPIMNLAWVHHISLVNGFWALVMKLLYRRGSGFRRDSGVPKKSASCF